jgi:DNA-binding LacI/PurR family transcriptional regulator
LRLEDVAAKAKVSVSTVSRVVTGHPSVKASTRKRVRAALEAVHYRPNLQARSLVAGRSNTLGIIVSNLENPFFVDIFHALEKEAHAAGYEVLVGNTNYDPERLTACIDSFLGRRVAGLAIIVSETISPALKQLMQADIPVAVYDARLPGKRRGSVRFDYAKGMTQLVEHLHSLGHERMAYIGYPLKLRPTDERRDAFVTAAKRLQIAHKYLFVRQDRDLFAGRDAGRDLLASGFDPTAILCVNDLFAVGVLRELGNRKISVPEQISVTGFDNIQIAEFSCPSLTTINIPRERIASTLFRSLVASEGKAGELAMPYTVDPELIVRESTGVAVKNSSFGTEPSL